ncbi:MAG: hypothetical protein A2Y15_04450 [Clostridiales bacterium GWF2_36_10]|nr:MAG: hypothetical protein A2Y15_04450 [Clostridiales bacterium GWF2_36_10]HAN20662.1 hypothetical protein [Clostridiales bacterium]
MKKSIKISHFGGPREADELVIYENLPSSGTNAYGIEAVVENGVLTSFGSNNREIPSGGFVVSGHGSAAHFMNTNVFEGVKIHIDKKDNILTVIADDDAKKIYYNNKLNEIKSRSRRSGVDVNNIIEKINGNIQSEKLDECKSLLEEAYIRTCETKKGEVRAIWHRPYERNIEQIDACVKRLADAGINLLLIETIYEGYSVAKRCTFMPLREDLIGTDFDMIDEFIIAGKKYGVEIHAWIENFFVGIENKDKSKGCGSPIVDLHPEWVAQKKNGSIFMKHEPGFIFFNAAKPEVREFLRDMYKKLLDEYAFDGIQLDYIRYPLSPSVDESVGFDDYSVNCFKEASGIDIRTIITTNCDEWKKFILWRAENVTVYVKMMYDLVHNYKNNGRKLTLSTAVFGNPDEAISLKSQNWQLWCKNGWLDCIYPMAYLHDAYDVYKEVKFMVENYGNVPNISGICPAYSHLPIIETTKQVEACRAAGAKGVAFFETQSFTNEQIEMLKIGAFRE